MVLTRSDTDVMLARFSPGELRQEHSKANNELAVARQLGDDRLEQYYSWYVGVLNEAVAKLPAPPAPRLANYSLNATAIKANYDLVKYIGQFVHLKHAGLNKYTGLCCFHADTIPSLFVYSERQDWYCYGCLRGGDIFNFAQFYYGVSFYEALKILAGEVK